MNSLLKNKLIILSSIALVVIFSFFLVFHNLFSPTNTPLSNSQLPPSPSMVIASPTISAQLPIPTFYLPPLTVTPHYNLSFFEYTYPIRYKNLTLDLQQNKTTLIVYYQGTRPDAQKELKAFFKDHGFNDPIESYLLISFVGLDTTP